MAKSHLYNPILAYFTLYFYFKWSNFTCTTLQLHFTQYNFTKFTKVHLWHLNLTFDVELSP